MRIEGQSGTVWSGTVTVDESTITDDQGVQHQLDEPTALGALDEASQLGGFPYVVQDTAYGLYVYSINGEEPAGMAGWMYRMDYVSPMVGAGDFILDQTTPPDPPHQEILFTYSEWGQSPLKVEEDNANLGVGDTFTSAHKLRHTFATMWLRNGGDSFMLQRLLGHTTLTMTNRYLQAVGCYDAIEAHKRYSPMDNLLRY